VVDRILGGVQSQIRSIAPTSCVLPRAGLKSFVHRRRLIWVVIVPILSFFLKDGRGHARKDFWAAGRRAAPGLVEDLSRT